VAIALLGGTFDPVHNAHLAMAEAALAHLPVKSVLFMPTGNTHYRTPAVAPARDRIEMLKLATREKPQFGIDERELAPGATGYTADALRSLRADLRNEQFFLLMGSDQYSKLDTWHRPDEVRRLASLAVFARPGFPFEDQGVKVIPFEPRQDAASEIRRRAARGEDFSGMVPAAVVQYIVRHNLYR
jgi:nicotinate-nucleotide adenylyltransferase